MFLRKRYVLNQGMIYIIYVPQRTLCTVIFGFATQVQILVAVLVLWLI